MTPAMRKGLDWIAAHQPVALFPVDGPSRTILKRLETVGFIERCGQEPGVFGCIKFQVSSSGYRALERDGR